MNPFLLFPVVFLFMPLPRTSNVPFGTCALVTSMNVSFPIYISMLTVFLLFHALMNFALAPSANGPNFTRPIVFLPTKVLLHTAGKIFKSISASSFRNPPVRNRLPPRTHVLPVHQFLLHPTRLQIVVLLHAVVMLKKNYGPLPLRKLISSTKFSAMKVLSVKLINVTTVMPSISKSCGAPRKPHGNLSTTSLPIPPMRLSNMLVNILSSTLLLGKPSATMLSVLPLKKLLPPFPIRHLPLLPSWQMSMMKPNSSMLLLSMMTVLSSSPWTKLLLKPNSVLPTNATSVLSG